MKTKIICPRTSAWFTLVVCLALRQSALAQFPALGDDGTQSLGQFRILVFTNFQAMLVGDPNYSPATHIYTSPVLYDGNTMIGRSAPLQDGSAGDIAGVAVGTAGTIVSETTLSVQPGGLGPVGTREVHTELRSMNMTGGGVAAARAGTNAVGRPISPGEVESHSGATGLPVNDFPATSFFDVFAQVDLPSISAFPGATNMFNDQPLLVLNTNITSFPPQVVYIHGMSTAVPIKFSNNNPSGLWTNGQIFGLLQLAGHDVTHTNSSQEQANLVNTLNAQIPAPVEPQYSNQVGAPVTIAGTNLLFPAKADDNTTSLGTFTILVNPAYQPFMAGYPGYNPSTKRLTSPLMFDQATKIGRSAALLEGSAADSNGVPVGTANTLVRDTNITLIPTLFESPNGTREVHTEIRTLNLAGGAGFAVRAGTAGVFLRGSYGEVESLSGPSGDIYWDFPAKSFFDVFVQVELPAGGAIPAAFQLSNSVPLVVQNNNLTKFPPQVIYVHGNTTAVPVLFRTAVPAIGANVGDTFGILMLAGHGISFTQTNTSDIVNFQTAMAQTPEAAVAPQYAGWGPGINVPLQIGSFALQGNLIQISGYCTANNTLLLQSANDLASQSWQTESQTTGTSNATFNVFTTKFPNTNVKFYRMVDMTR